MRCLLLISGLMGALCLVNCGGVSSSSTPANPGSGGPVVLKSIQLNPSSASIAMGTMQSFTATGKYSDGSTKDLTLTATWSCVLPAIATVSNSTPTQGLATSVSPGTVLVTASSGNVSGSAQLAIKAVTPTAIVVSPATATIGFGTQLQFSASATFSDMSTQDVTNSATWTSFPPFITSGSGLAIGKSVGVNTITATLQGVSSANPAMLTVDFSNLASVAIVPSTSSIARHTRTQLVAIGTFNDGSTRDISSQVSWASSDATVAVFGVTGSLVSGNKVGSADITATAGTLTASSTLNVTGAQLQSITVSPGNASLASGVQQGFTAMGLFSDSTTQDLTTQVAWSVLDSTIASATPKGKVTGLSAGATTVNATSSLALGFIQGAAALTVTSATLNSIALSPATAIIVPGGSLAYSAAGSFSDGTTQDVTLTSLWMTGSKNVATVSSGVATGQGVGSSTIVARMGSASATATLLVAAPSQFSLAITPATAQIAAAASTQLTVTGTFIDGTTQDLTTIASWSSSAPNVATVGAQSGIVSGLTTGQSTITATLGTVSAKMTVTVQ